MSRRENIYDDDYVELMLDTFHDSRHALVFAVNPLGVQADGLWTEGGGGTDNSWDTVWDSAGKLTGKGYVVMQEIPFPQLALSRRSGPDLGSHAAALQSRETASLITGHGCRRASPGKLTQEGTFSGLEGISPGRNLQIFPISRPAHSAASINAIR